MWSFILRIPIYCVRYYWKNMYIKKKKKKVRPFYSKHNFLDCFIVFYCSLYVCSINGILFVPFSRDIKNFLKSIWLYMVTLRGINIHVPHMPLGSAYFHPDDIHPLLWFCCLFRMFMWSGCGHKRVSHGGWVVNIFFVILFIIF